MYVFQRFLNGLSAYDIQLYKAVIILLLLYRMDILHLQIWSFINFWILEHHINIYVNVYMTRKRSCETHQNVN